MIIFGSVLAAIVALNMTVFIWDRAYVWATIFTLSVGFGTLILAHSLFWVLRWIPYPITRKRPVFLLAYPEDIQEETVD